MDETLLIARLLLAAIFAVAGAAKLADLAGSRAAVEGFGVPATVARLAGTALPLAELAVATLLPFASTARAGATGALVLLALFCVGITRSIVRGEAPDCHCFGQLHSEPAGPRTLVRNLILACIAAFVIFAGADPGPGLSEAIGALDTTAAVALGAALAVTAVFVAGTFAFLSVLREHGRLLLRLEALENALRERGIQVPEIAGVTRRQAGLPVGAVAPDFTLPSTSGDEEGLDTLTASGRPLLLTFTDPNCAPCNQLLPHLGEWKREHEGRLKIAVISRGDMEANRAKAEEHGLGPILLQHDREVAEAYSAPATPSAVLIDREGRVGSAVAAGDAAIAALVTRASKDPVQVVRAGPRVERGDPIPALETTLRNLEDEPVELGSALAGGERVLLFWNPACGFCKRMLDDLRDWEREVNGAEQLLVVSTGDSVTNREQRLRAPILLDDSFAVGRSVGARGTPAAVRIDSEGRVASQVAVGADAVLALARNAET